MSRQTAKVNLLASATKTGNGTSDLVTGVRSYRGITVELDVTAAASDVDDTLNVYVQRQLPGGDYDDIVAFTQVLGNGGAKRFVADVMFDSQASDERVARDAALATGTVVAVPFGDVLRVKWVIVDPGGGAVSFTFSVAATLLF